jgi:molybdopterin-biosynthesis enzyme MoeA-like protein
LSRAALLVIGSKILSGRTKDQNIGYVAECLTAVGIDLKELRVVGDDAPGKSTNSFETTTIAAAFFGSSN